MSSSNAISLLVLFDVTKGFMLWLEIQLQKPDMFGNLFLGLDPFHMENIAMTFLGKYFWCSDMDIALVEADIYGQEVVQSKVMNGVHYIKGKERIAVIAEAMSSLMFQCFKLEKASFELDQHLDSNEEAIKDITLSDVSGE